MKNNKNNQVWLNKSEQFYSILQYKKKTSRLVRLTNDSSWYTLHTRRIENMEKTIVVGIPTRLIDREYRYFF